MKLNKYFILITMLSASLVHAQQGLDDEEIVNVEGVYSSTQTTENKHVDKNTSKNLPSQLKESNSAVEVKDITDLNRLAPFSEVSVIQRKFMPKTERFQLFAAGALMTNTPWYNNVGAKLNLSYNFTESFGLELNSTFLTNTERESTKEIKDSHGLQAEQFIYTKSYAGLDLVWSPIYGKMSALDESIIPFDMYFAIGGGSSSTNSLEGNNPTFHFGLGQIFSLSKSMALRWDYSFNTFSATPATPNAQKNSYNDLILSAGISFFFPEVTYR